MRGVGEDVGVFGVQVAVEIARVKDGSEFCAAVERLRSVVCVQFVQALELRFLGRVLVDVGAELYEADCIAFFGGGFEEREEVRCQDYVAHVVGCHVEIDAGFVELVGHYATGGVVD